MLKNLHKKTGAYPFKKTDQMANSVTGQGPLRLLAFWRALSGYLRLSNDGLWNNEYIPVHGEAIQTNSVESDPQWHHRHLRHHINIFIRISVQKNIWKRKVFDDFFHCLFVVGILCVGLRPGWALTDTSGNKGAREKKWRDLWKNKGSWEKNIKGLVKKTIGPHDKNKRGSGKIWRGS